MDSRQQPAASDTPSEGVTWPSDDPAALETAFGTEIAAILFAFQERLAGDAARLERKAAEIKADPEHPERPALWSYTQRARTAQRCRTVQRRNRSHERTSPQLSSASTVSRSTPRARGAGRPRARAASRGGDSGDDSDLPGEPSGPPPTLGSDERPARVPAGPRLLPAGPGLSPIWARGLDTPKREVRSSDLDEQRTTPRGASAGSQLADAHETTAAVAATPSPGARVCACGCGRDISDLRSDAVVANNSCQRRLDRRNASLAVAADAAAAAASRWRRTLPVVADIAKVDAAITRGTVDADVGARLTWLLIKRRLQQLRGRNGGLRTDAGVPYGGCNHGVVCVDPDGDAMCAKCGHLVGRVACSINGYDATSALMAANGLDSDSATRHPHWARFAGVVA